MPEADAARHAEPLGERVGRDRRRRRAPRARRSPWRSPRRRRRTCLAGCHERIMACLKSFSSPFRSTLMPPWAAAHVVQLVAVVALAAIVVVVAILLSGGDDEQEAAAPSPAATPGPPDATPGIPQNGIHLGEGRSADAGRVRRPAVPVLRASTRRRRCRAVVRDYVRTGKVRYELRFRSFLGRDSVRAARGAAAAAAKQNLDVPVRRRLLPQPGPRGVGLRDRRVHPQDRRAGPGPRSRQGRGRARTTRSPAGVKASERVRARDRLDRARPTSTSARAARASRPSRPGHCAGGLRAAGSTDALR